tara:strand:+ start:45 stop:977 length:933 start_codon:yes stop_codon:yes gene_type:complete
MKIIKVTSDNIDSFNKEIKTPNLIAFVKIYSDSCGHCKAMESDWTQLEKELENEDLNGLLASISSDDIDSADCNTDNSGVPTLRVYEGGEMKMDYEGKRETADMKLFFKNLLKPKQKGGRRKSTRKRRKSTRRRRKYRKKRTRKKKKRGKRGGFCLTKKCKEEKQKKKEEKKDIQIHKDFENERYKLVQKVCDMKDENEYNTCVNKIAGNSKTVDELIKNIDNSTNTAIKPPTGVPRRNTPPGMRRRYLKPFESKIDNPPGLSRKNTPPGLSRKNTPRWQRLQQMKSGGKRTHKNRSHKRKKRRKSRKRR